MSRTDRRHLDESAATFLRYSAMRHAESLLIDSAPSVPSLSLFSAIRGQAKAQCHLVFDNVCNILISLGRSSESARRLRGARDLADHLACSPKSPDQGPDFRRET